MEICGLTEKQSPQRLRHLRPREMCGLGYNRDWIERQPVHADNASYAFLGRLDLHFDGRSIVIRSYV